MQIDGDSVTMTAAELRARFDAAMACELMPAFRALAVPHIERTRGADAIAAVRMVGSIDNVALIVEWRSGAEFRLPFSLIGTAH